MELGGGEKKRRKKKTNKQKTKPTTKKTNQNKKKQPKPEQNCITVIFPGEESESYRNIGLPIYKASIAYVCRIRIHSQNFTWRGEYRHIVKMKWGWNYCTGKQNIHKFSTDFCHFLLYSCLRSESYHFVPCVFDWSSWLVKYLQNVLSSFPLLWEKHFTIWKNWNTAVFHKSLKSLNFPIMLLREMPGQFCLALYIKIKLKIETGL